MKTVLIIGDDKLGHKAIVAMGPDVQIYLNRSSSPARILKLVLKGTLSVKDFLIMAWAEYCRRGTQIPDLPVLKSNRDVIDMLKREKPDRVICFRAGLIIGRATLEYPPQFLNLHYADLPEWGGLGSIPRALRAGAFEQNACLHVMVPEIDGGEVLERQPYRIDPKLPYKDNEMRGFAAGLMLLQNVIAR